MNLRFSQPSFADKFLKATGKKRVVYFPEKLQQADYFQVVVLFPHSS